MASHWRIPPVDVLTFTRDFLQRRHSPPQEAFLTALYGTDPRAFWPDSPKVYALCWGMGSGKNFTIESAVVYFDYLLMCLHNPQMYFWGLNEARFIDALNFSFVTVDQAREVFFDSMKMVLRSCINPETGRPWFEEQGVDLRDNGIGDIKEKVIELPRGIRNRCIPATRAGFEGSNILLAVFDEPSRAVESVADNLAAHRLFEKVKSNTTTRFGHRSKIAAFSYPQAQEGDLIMELCYESTLHPEEVWSSRHPTYEVNPHRNYEHFEAMRRDNPELYTTIIECNPPASLTGFYRAHPEKIADTFREDVKPRVEWERYVSECEVKGNDGRTVIRKYTAIRLLRVITKDEYPRAIGGDCGHTGDSFSFAMGYASKAPKSLELVVETEVEAPLREPVTGQPSYTIKDGQKVQATETRNVQTRLRKRIIDRLPVIDLIIELKPITVQERGKPLTVYPIDFGSVRDFIVQLKLHFTGIRRAQFDYWQAVAIMQDFVRAGINAETVPFSNAKQVALYTQHRQLVYNDYIAHTPCPAAVRQFRELQDIDGRKVDHPPQGCKDLSDAIVLCTDAILTSGPVSRFFS